MAKKTYVLDTSACLSDADCIYSYANNDIVIPLKVLEEIDKHKKRQDGVGVNARTIIRAFDELRSKGNLQQGVRIAKGKGILKVRSASLECPPDLDPTVPDHIIIATALAENHENGTRKTIVVTRDINMRVICDSLGLISEDYTENQIIKKDSDLYTGFSEILVDDQTIDHFYEDEIIIIDPEDHPGLCPNQFIMLVSSSNDKKTALCKFIDYKTGLLRVSDFKTGLWGVKAKNKEQAFALDLLMDPDVQVISLVGKAGSGKTLLAIAAGLEQVMPNYPVDRLSNKMGAPNKKYTPNPGALYKKLVVSRPVMPMGKDIGYLPGSMQDKMAPWLAPIQDNLKFLTGDDQTTLDDYMDRGLIEMEALTYIRGRSIANAYIVIDEAQNLTAHEIKTILTRVGEGTKIVLTGDIEQIDNIYINETSSGLVHAVEKFKDLDISGHVTLRKGERSRVATIAAKVL
jgi:PhoH-like ATPase